MSAPPLHAVQISFFNDPAQRTPRELLEAWSTLVDVAEAVARSGVRVSVVQACAHVQQLEVHGVRYHFLPFGSAGSAGERREAALIELLRALAPDVLHVHGLGFHREVALLAALQPCVPIVLQDHASRPPPLWRRAAWRRGMAPATAVTFCAAAQARPFQQAGLLGARVQVYEIPESTCRFTPGERAQARRETDLEGDPAMLWVGHLDTNKDPLAVLEGVRLAARDLPNLRLYCCFGTAPLLSAVQQRIASDAVLQERVRLLGRVPHTHIEQLMRAADIFVLGSHREGSGYSLIEALACGLPPVVTDIPSFRALTAGGAVGALWPCGDTQTLSRALQSVAVRTDAATRAAVRAHFERELSFESLGSKLAAMYAQVIERHGTPLARCAPQDA
jgi:glycosyltransferase involved in cell wall biosynthesis